MLDLWTIDAVWISVAFLLGLIAKRINLPPLIGYLVGGFLLNFMGVNEGGLALHIVAELGVMLLLFTIGLKLDIRSLLSKEIWLTASLHMTLSVLALGTAVFLLSFFAIGGLSTLSWQSATIIGFALSFSSTVFAVKVLEERGEMTSFHGNISIGILVIQDIIAVIFLTISKGELPNMWAFALPIYLYIVRFILIWFLKFIDQGELLTLFGFMAAFVAGAIVFDFVGLKADLGALTIGLLIGSHHRSKELAKHMLGFKDFFLIAFFLDIGLTGLPNLNIIFIALIITLFIPLKAGLFMLILTRLNLRARTSWHVSLSLSNYSEFGLIISILGLKMGLLSEQWLIILALALSFSYVLASPVNHRAHKLFEKYAFYLRKLNTPTAHPDDQPTELGDAEVIICGMGHIGRAAYHQLTKDFENKVIGIDYNKNLVRKQQEAFKNIVWGDTTDSNFWMDVKMPSVKIILITMDDHASNLNTALALGRCKIKKFSVSAPGHNNDEILELKQSGVDFVYNYYNRAGIEFAGSFMNYLEQRKLEKQDS
jgi:predicted Kef-type K+ transport protein